jgi:hypothetical protein
MIWITWNLYWIWRFFLWRMRRLFLWLRVRTIEAFYREKETFLSSSSSRWKKAIATSNCYRAVSYSISSIRPPMDLVLINQFFHNFIFFSSQTLATKSSNLNHHPSIRINWSQSSLLHWSSPRCCHLSSWSACSRIQNLTEFCRFAAPQAATKCPTAVGGLATAAHLASRLLRQWGGQPQPAPLSSCELLKKVSGILGFCFAGSWKWSTTIQETNIKRKLRCHQWYFLVISEYVAMEIHMVGTLCYTRVVD